MFIKKALKYLFMCFLLCVAQGVPAADSPITLLQSTSDQVLQALKEKNVDENSDPNIVHSVVEQYLLPHVDVTGMSRSVLGRVAWKNANENQRRRFSQEFTQLVIRTYSGALARYKNEHVRFEPIRGGYQDKSRVQVHSTVTQRGGPDIPMSYRLVLLGNQWKVYDITVEGVSLLRSFRNQFAAELSHGSLDALIKYMSANNGKKH